MSKSVQSSRSRLYLSMVALIFQLLTANSLMAAPQQGKPISISVKNMTLSDVLIMLSRKSGVRIFFMDTDVQPFKGISYDAKEKDVTAILDQLLKDKGLEYQYFDNIITIKRSNSVMSLTAEETDTTISVTGKIIGENGQPILGATVKTKNGKSGTITDQKGVFSFTDVSPYQSLVISAVGFFTTEVLIRNRSDLGLIQLKEQVGQLDQIQVIGYGAISKRLNPANVASVSGKVIQDQPITNLAQALSGRVAGLQITQTNGLPGSAINIQIRGRNSIGANNNPLYIVDGVPFTSNAVETINGPQGAGAGSPLNLISPADIESIEILKDAAATAIYGSRASNGVVLITTKKGTASKNIFNVAISSGISKVTRVAKTLSIKELLQLRKDAFANSGVVQTPGNAPDILLWNSDTDFNWQDWYIGNTASFTDASANLSGGTGQTTFLLSTTYHRETNVLPGNDAYTRGNFHLSLNHASTDKRFNITSSFFYTTDKNNLPSPPVSLRDVATAIPNYPIYDSLGNYNWTANKSNYVALATAYYKGETDNLNGNLNLKYTIIPGLDLKINTGFNQIQNRQIAANPSTSINPALQQLAYSSFTNQRIRTLVGEPQVNYKRSIGVGNIDFIAGATIQSMTTNGQFISVGNYSNDLLIESLSYGTVSSQTSTRIDYKYLSFFSRANYTILNKYIASGTLRRDGSSRFGADKKFGNFGSIGLAWLFTNENFFKHNKLPLSFGKLRGSYGTTGNDGIRDYGFLNLYSNTNSYGGTVAIQPYQIANNHYQWEVNKKLEVALETGFIRDRILFNIAFYRNRSGNQLVGFDIPATTGFSRYQANLPAVVENRGWEFELNTTNVNSRRFKWSSSANITISKNKLISFPGLSTSTYANSLILGKSLNTVQLFRFLGVDPQTGKPLIDDVNKNGSYDYEISSYNNQGGDYVNVGTTDPKWYGGLYNSISFSNFSFEFLFQYVKQDGYSQIRYSGFGRIFNNWKENLNYWKKEGDVVDIPKPYSNSNADNTAYAFSNATFTDASFLRLKNITIAYVFPEKILKNRCFQQLKIQAQGQNLLTFTKYKGYDPETAGSPTIPIPPLKTFTIGLTASF